MRQAPAGGGAFPGIQQVLFVDISAPATVAPDGSAGKPYNLPSQAYAAAKLLAPSATFRIEIVIMGGEYTDKINLDTSYIDIVGIDRDSVRIKHTVAGTILNCGGALYFTVRNLTLVSATDAVYPISTTAGPNMAYFDNVRVTMTGNLTTNSVRILQTGSYRWTNCIFDGQTTQRTLVIEHGGHIFQNCTIYGQVRLIWSVEYEGVKFHGCAFGNSTGIGASIIIETWAGQEIEFDSCYFAGGGGTTVIQQDISAYLRVSHCVFEMDNIAAQRALYITAAGYLKWINNSSYVISETVNINHDIYSNVALDPAKTFVSGNHFCKGMNGNIRHVNPIKKVGGFVDQYVDIVEALASCTVAGDVVLLHADVTITAALTPSQTGTTMFDGQGRFTITRAAGSPVLTAGSECDIRFRQVRLVGSIDITAAAAKVSLLDQAKLTGMVDITSGATSTSRFFMDQAEIVADATDHHAIAVGDADAEIYVFRSYLKGNGTEPAIDNPADNAHIHLAHSTVMNGTSANAPMAAAGTPAFSSHHNTYGADPAASGYANDIATPYDVVDPSGDWGWMAA